MPTAAARTGENPIRDDTERVHAREILDRVGVVTDPASVPASAWKALFDEVLPFPRGQVRSFVATAPETRRAMMAACR